MRDFLCFCFLFFVFVFVFVFFCNGDSGSVSVFVGVCDDLGGKKEGEDFKCTFIVLPMRSSSCEST